MEVRVAPAIIVGARKHYQVINTADFAELAGFVVEPGGFADLFGERADLLFEKSAPLSDFWPRFRSDRVAEAPTPVEKLDCLEQLLKEQIAHPDKRPALIDEALRFLDHPNRRVRDCASFVGVSERRLAQVFREQVGVSPKLWCRIRRFQTAARDLHRGIDVPWAELALRCGYYDQSHFINDFQAFSGLNPVTYSTLHRRWQNHIPLA